MREKVFIDSNIWLYAFLRQDEKKRQAAKKLIKSINNNSIRLSTQIINELCINLKKNKFPESEIKELLVSFYKDYRVISFNQEIMLRASGLREIFSFFLGQPGCIGGD